MTQIAFIGAGNMAGSLIRGLIESGHPPSALRAADISAAQLERYADLNVMTSSDNAEVTNGADVVVLAVKPQVLVPIVRNLPLEPHQLVISIAAGIDMAALERAAPAGQPIVRCMPNTPALVGAGMAGLFANAPVSEPQRESAEAILSAVGQVVWLAEETLIDAVTAVSGSGPAYFFYLMEHMVTAGTQLGLSRAQATQLTLQTAHGAALLAMSSEDGPAQLRANVTSPGGTTERALATLNEAGVSDAIVRALNGAAVRSAELAKEFGEA